MYKLKKLYSTSVALFETHYQSKFNRHYELTLLHFFQIILDRLWQILLVTEENWSPVNFFINLPR